MRRASTQAGSVPVILRREVPDDHDVIRAVHTAAFGADRGGPGDEARLVEELRADGSLIAALCLVALHDGAVVGHVACHRGAIGDRSAIGLGPLGVLPAHQGTGVGHALMHGVLAAADALDEPAVLLLGDPGFYRRFGFVPAGAVGVAPPDPAWAGHFLVRTLTGWDPTLTGTFRYPNAFARL